MKTSLPDNQFEALKEGLLPQANAYRQLKARRILGKLGYIPVDETGSLLNEDQWRSLKEGFSTGASNEERKKAEDTLEGIGFISHVNATSSSPANRRPPGPKKKSRINPVEEELRRLLGTIRSVMSVDADLSKPRTLNILLHVLWLGHDLLRENLFFKKQELRDISLVGDAWRSLSPDPIVEKFSMHLQALIQCLKIPNNSDEIQFDDLVFDSSNSRETQTENQIYSDLALSLMLVAKGHNSPSRAEILKTAIGRLSHFKKLFSEVHKSIPADDVAPLYRILRDAPWLNTPRPVSKLAGRISDIFLTACNRQGIYPFQGETIKDFIFDPAKPLQEGEISTGG